ncbi:MAG: septum formation inhibitor Maf [Candidatus Accumulibacter sp.]|jgi:septum formation protein|uniref:Maf family protein n=1 Tax=Accumulibacter sp. TaxID=2053492 RepID=UPI002088EEF1|nr:nucleoside triphosphate pyrophosphatase [Accumulibacter sp.]MBK8116881.1 septum formation inhibitor Maf [Accumulibacter sp.]MBK8580061.1 septum formation inhibitor Maf [Candidatus Accumulibacter propinquus]
MPVDLQHARLHLASRSPRRRELLTQIGVAFDSIIFRNSPREDPELDETPLPDEDPVGYVQRIARNKAEHGCRIAGWRKLLPQPVLAADTILEVGGRLVGKPLDTGDAERILQTLSGNTHRVLTAVAVAAAGRLELAVSISEVRFRPLDAHEITRYVASGEPMDKAGAYAIQGRAGMFVAHLAGSYSGVMGLPLCETAQLLKRFGYRL